MAKSFPEMIVLKARKCPECGTQFGHPPLHVVDTAVQAGCHTEGCSYRLELFWLGDASALVN